MVELEDGSGRVETWSPRQNTWKPGGATVDEFFFSPPATPEFMRSKVIPEADIEEMTKAYRG